MSICTRPEYYPLDHISVGLHLYPTKYYPLDHISVGLLQLDFASDVRTLNTHSASEQTTDSKRSNRDSLELTCRSTEDHCS
jgi:hypothetical protein